MEFNVSPNPKTKGNSKVFPKAFESSHRNSLSLSSSNSSSSSSSQYFSDDSSSRPPLSPSTPLMRFSSGVPFSWEKLPGIPKAKQASYKRTDSSASSQKLSSLLPLPPSVTPRKHGIIGEGSFRKKSSPEWDPFVAALVECSKGDDHEEEVHKSTTLWTGAKITRSISDRFGFLGLYASCKRTCAIDESIIYVPRPRRTVPTQTSYGLIRYQHHQ